MTRGVGPRMASRRETTGWSLQHLPRLAGGMARPYTGNLIRSPVSRLNPRVLAAVATGAILLAVGAWATYALRDAPDSVPEFAAGEAPPLVVLVIVDTLRRDSLSVYNPDAPPTPELEAFAGRRANLGRHAGLAHLQRMSVARWGDCSFGRRARRDR